METKKEKYTKIDKKRRYKNSKKKQKKSSFVLKSKVLKQTSHTPVLKTNIVYSIKKEFLGNPWRHFGGNF